MKHFHVTHKSKHTNNKHSCQASLISPDKHYLSSPDLFKTVLIHVNKFLALITSYFDYSEKKERKKDDCLINWLC